VKGDPFSIKGNESTCFEPFRSTRTCYIEGSQLVACHLILLFPSQHPKQPSAKPPTTAALVKVIPFFTEKKPLLATTLTKTNHPYSTKMRASFMISACAVLLAGTALAQESAPASSSSVS
jgi:hypothetical protein